MRLQVEMGLNKAVKNIKTNWKIGSWNTCFCLLFRLTGLSAVINISWKQNVLPVITY